MYLLDFLGDRVLGRRAGQGLVGFSVGKGHASIFGIVQVDHEPVDVGSSGEGLEIG